MKVKLLFTYLLVSFSMTLNAQETKSTCDFDYNVIAEKNSEGLDYKDRYVNFKWDVSKIAAENEVSIEIVKIFDCFTGIDGVQTEKYQILNLIDKDLSAKKSFKIKHVDMLAKCFKWRVILKSDTCQEQTNWNYYTFID